MLQVLVNEGTSEWLRLPLTCLGSRLVIRLLAYSLLETNFGFRETESKLRNFTKNRALF